MSNFFADTVEAERPNFFADTLPPAPTPSPAPAPRGALGYARDTAIDLGKGVVGLGESVVGLGDIASFGLIGKGLAAIGYDPKQTQAFLSGLQTEARQKSEGEVSQADGFWDSLKAIGTHPDVLFGKIVESLPGTVGAGAAAGMLVRRLAATAAAEATAAGLTGEKATEFIASQVKEATFKIAATASGAEGAQAGGSIAEAGRQSGREWSEYVAPAIAAGLGTAAIGMVSGKIGQKLGIGDVETDVAVRAAGVRGAGVGAGNWASRVGKETAKEGLLEEMPQSAQEQAWQNVATGRPVGEGVATAAAQGLAVGGAMGGGHAAIAGHATPKADPVAEILNAPDVDAAIKAAAESVAVPVAAPELLESQPVDPLLSAMREREQNPPTFAPAGTEPATLLERQGLGDPLAPIVEARNQRAQESEAIAASQEAQKQAELDAIQQSASAENLTAEGKGERSRSVERAAELQGPTAMESALQRAAMGALPKSAETVAAIAEPVKTWFGRAGDGYKTEGDAQMAMPSRQRNEPDLMWKIEPMPSGKFRLAGYAQEGAKSGDGQVNIGAAGQAARAASEDAAGRGSGSGGAVSPDVPGPLRPAGLDTVRPPAAEGESKRALDEGARTAAGASVDAAAGRAAPEVARAEANALSAREQLPTGGKSDIGSAGASSGGVRVASESARVPADSEAARSSTARPEAVPSGVEVSRYTGKFGKGMGRDAARLEASRLNREAAKTESGITYTAEEHGDAKLENPYAVVGRKVGEPEIPARPWLKNEDLAGKTADELDAMHTQAIEHNREVDLQAIRKFFPEQAKEAEGWNKRKREAWLTANETDESSAWAQARYMNDELIAQHRNAGGDFDTESPEALGRSIAIKAKNVDEPGFMASPEGRSFTVGRRYAKDQGWNLDAALAGMRERSAEWAGNDAPELFSRLFKKATGENAKLAAPEPSPASPKLEAESKVAPEDDTTKGAEKIVSGVGDDLVTLYHGTTEEGADSIKREGVIRSGSYFGVKGSAVALAPTKDVAKEYGDGKTIVEVRIPRNKLIVDPESNDNPDVDRALSEGYAVYATGDIHLNESPAPSNDGVKPAEPPPAAPKLEDAAKVAPEPTKGAEPASWVIRNKATGEVVMETFDRKKVDALNTDKYEAVPIGEHLGNMNGRKPGTDMSGRPLEKTAEPIPDATRAESILDAAGIKGAERISALKDVKSGAITVDELARAHPAPTDEASGVNSAARQISEAMRGDVQSDYALRVLQEDVPEVRAGDKLPPSRRWDDGTDTGEHLSGTSGVHIKTGNLEAVQAALRDLGAHRTGNNGYYPGRRVVLIKGERVGSGEDKGEVLLKNAEVVEQWSKSGEDAHPITPNESAPNRSGKTGEGSDTAMAAMVEKRGETPGTAFATGDRSEPSFTREEFSNEVGRIADKFGGLGLVLPLWSSEELPEHVKQSAADAGIPLGRVRGVATNDGKVYVIGNVHADLVKVQETVFHELYGHQGLRSLFGKSLYAKLDDLYLRVGVKGFVRIAEKYGVDLSTYADVAAKQSTAPGIAQAAGGRAQAIRGILMDELLAHIAQSETGTLQQKAREIIGAIRDWLRSHGFARLAEYGETDLAHLLKQGRQALVQGSDNMAFALTETAPASFAVSTVVGATDRVHTPEQKRAMRNVGFEVDVPTLAERAKSLWQGAGNKMAQGIFDQFAPVQSMDKEAYRLLRQSKTGSGALATFLHAGKLKLVDNTYAFDDTQWGGVIDKLLIPMQGEHHDALRWVAANRAQQLLNEWTVTLADGTTKIAQGKAAADAMILQNPGAKAKATPRENLFTQADIDALKTLADGATKFDYTIQTGPDAGQVTRDRTKIYADFNRVLKDFNNNVLDMVEQSGGISAQSRAAFGREFYLPFYRDEGENGILGAVNRSGMVRQQFVKQLKGGKEKLNADLLDNTLMNWAHLLDAAAKNRGAKATLEAAERMGLALNAPQYTAKHIASATDTKNGLMWVMDGGEKRFYVLDTKAPEGPAILTALSALEYAGMRGPLMDAMGAFKHVLTVGVTASPFFKVRNLIRDSLQVTATSGIGYNVAANIAQGIKLTDPKSAAYWDLMAGGGMIHFGAMLEGSEAKRVQALVESGVDASTILNSDQKVKTFYRKFIEPSITAYNELGNRGEAINRAALYDQLIKQGVGHGEASLQARDMMDFSMQGSFATIRFLTQTVPFFNARLQGLYKLGKAAKEDPARFSAVLGATALFSLALLAAYGDDDDWKKRELWDRQNFWWFKFGGTAFRIPKPFEIGAIATLAEHGAELMFDQEMTGKQFRKAVLQLTSDQLSMNPLPQMVKPILDVYSNKDSFSNRPIETMGMEHLKPDYRFTDRTSMTARAASTGMNAVTSLAGIDSPSPVQVDHMLRGYFGWLGSFIVGAGDVLARPATGQPTHPAPDYWKSATGNMVSELSGAPSKYVSQMYDQAKELEQAYGTWRSMLKEGKTEQAREFFEDNRGELIKYRKVETIKRAEAQFNERVRLIERSNMEPTVKRDLIQSIRAQQDRVSRL